MDTISGLNRVIVHTDGIEATGNVKISNGINEWSSPVVNNAATFIIPSIPVPGRKTYVASYGDKEKEIPIGYGAEIEVYLHEDYEYTTAKGVANAIEKVSEDLNVKIGAVASTLVAGDKTFKFGVDADGNYGYVKKVDGADTVIPFKTGVHIKSLGVQGGRGKASYTVSVTDIMSDKEYKKLTADNFFLVPQAVNAAVQGDQNGAYAVSGSYRPPKKSYSESTGVLTVTASLMSVAGLTGGGSYGTDEVFVVY